ncbi:unnamed protein product, partial [Hymenolepis diminuta]
NNIQFSSILFKYLPGGPNIFHSHSSSDFNCLGRQLVDNVKRQILISQWRRQWKAFLILDSLGTRHRLMLVSKSECAISNSPFLILSLNFLSQKWI